MRRVSLLLGMGVLFLSATLAFGQDISNQGSANPQVDKAKVPRLVRFNGVVKESTGKPHNGVADVTFSLYREEEGGEALWFETQTVEADAQGRYSVLLGAMHSDGLPMDLFTSGEARWLGVSVSKLPEPARVLLVAVPYALKAADADTLGGKPATSFVASDQLKDQVRNEVKSQASQSGSATRTLVGTAPSPQAMGEGQSSFLCNLAADCVAVAQSGSGAGLHATTPTGNAVLGELSATAGAAIFGKATAATGVAYGLQGDAVGTSAAGVFGRAWASTGTTRGVFGRAFSINGIGVHGDAPSATGATRGVWGSTASAAGVGVYGQSSKASGFTTGVTGTAASTSGVGVLGIANAASGWTVGVQAKALSPAGTALVADNTAGGKIFSGQNGGFEKFGVSGAGNLTASGTGQFGGVVTGTRFSSTVATGTSPLVVNSTTQVPNLNADMIDGVHAGSLAQLGTNNVFTGTANFSGNTSTEIVSITQSGLGRGLSVGSSHTGIFSSGGSYGVYALGPVAGVYGDGGSTGSSYGVYGADGSATGFGVYGYNTSNVGVQGYGPNGVSGDSGAIANGIGVVGTSTNAGGIGVYGTNTSNVGIWGYGYRGVYGSSGSLSAGYGVWGYSSASDGYGTVGSNPNGVGVFGSGNTSTGWGVYGYGNYGVYGYGVGASATGVAGLGTYYGVFSFGNMGATGLKPAVVPLSDDRLVMVYAVESPEVWFEDFGSAQLQNGAAQVDIEAVFLQTVNTDITYHVFLTPTGECQGLYLANRTPSGFEVRELAGGRSDVSFDYRIVARRKGYEDVRMQQVGADSETVQEIRRQTKVRNMPKIRMPKLQMPKGQAPAMPEPPNAVPARGPRAE